MTTQSVAALPRPNSAYAVRYLISAAVAAAIAGSALPQRAIAADEDALSEIVVTGSRIVRTRDLSAPSPVVTVGKDAFDNTAQTGAEAVLNTMPQFVPINTQFTSSIQGSATSNPGAGCRSRAWPAADRSSADLQAGASSATPSSSASEPKRDACISGC